LIGGDKEEEQKYTCRFRYIGAFIREDSVSKSNHKNKYFLTEEKI